MEKLAPMVSGDNWQLKKNKKNFSRDFLQGNASKRDILFPSGVSESICLNWHV